MTYSIWTVVNSVLSTATVDNIGRLVTIEPATICPALIPQRPNFVELLETGADFTTLGRTLTGLIGGVSVDHLAVDAVPCDLNVFGRGVPYQPTFVPTLTVEIERRPTGELINTAALDRLNTWLTSVKGSVALGNDTGCGFPPLLPLRITDLPRTLEVVVATEAKYFHDGRVFRVDSRMGPIGLHRRSVEAIECELTDPHDSETLLAHKAHSRAMRKFRTETVDRILKLRSLVNHHGCNRNRLRELLHWLGSEGDWHKLPGFLTDLEGLQLQISECQLYGIRLEFAPFREALVETIRSQVAANWIGFTTAARLSS